MQTIMITGCSSGFGLETARLFAERGWDVVATVRGTGDISDGRDARIRVLQLDVTSPASIAAAVAAAGPIDVLVNNAGIGLLNAVEATPMDTARQLFETNTLGTIAMVQAVVPQMRARGGGTIVNIGSSATYRAEPLLSVYSATKAAVNAFTDGVALELAPFGIRVRLVVPGRAPTTGFNQNARALMEGGFPDAYAGQVERVFAGWARDRSPTTSPRDVAEAVWTAVTVEDAPAHIPAGPDAAAPAAAA